MNQYETLSSLFEKTDAFSEKGITLLEQLRQTVWSELSKFSSENETRVINRFD